MSTPDIATWKVRYIRRIVDRTDLGYAEALEVLQQADWTEIYEGYEDDPEGSADEELSCWEEG